MEYVVSGRRGRSYTELFERAMADGPFTAISSAVAYATVGGVNLLERTLRGGLGGGWDAMQKRWLVGIDWCRSDPPALDRLGALPNSTIKVPSGEAVVTTAGCTPSQTYHPKLFMLTGGNRTSIICGSGNLSRNGLSRGCEVGGVITLNGTDAGDEPNPQAKALLSWFRTEWQRADRYDVLALRYEAACRDRVRRRAIVPTEDDTKPAGEAGGVRGRALTEEQIHELRTFKNFWIDAGALGANLGAGVPGNQLDMKRFTRAFFGAGIEDLEPQTEIDPNITLVWDGVPHSNRTLKYGDNQMDKLNVPPAGERGRTYYRGKTLLFRRRPDGGYDFLPGDNAQRQRWRQASEARGVVHRLSPTREWGLF